MTEPTHPPRPNTPPTTDGQTDLAALIEQYQQLQETDSETAVALRHSFIQAIKEQPTLVKQRVFANFLASEIEPEKIAKLEWDSPNQMLRFSESLYQSRFE